MKQIILVVGGLFLHGLAKAQAPQITALNPGRNALAVPRAGNVAVTFTTLPNNTLASKSALKVSSSQRGGLLAGQATITGNTLTFDPATSFIPGEQVSVTVTRQLQSGTAFLSAPAVYQFTTAVGGGTGTFVGSSRIPGLSSSVMPADFDNDGDLDLMYTSSNGFRICRSNGNGTFAASYLVLAQSDPNGVAVADMNGDGNLDLIASNSLNLNRNGGVVSVSLGDGTGAFAAVQSVPVGYFTWGLAVGDVNGDGYPDAITVNDYTKVGVLLNSGTGTLGALASFDLGMRPSKLLLGDLDNDGDLDLVASNGTSLVISKNNSAGLFSAATTIMQGTIGQPALADVDGDGDLDLLAANVQDLKVYLNDGRAAFSISSTMPLVSGNAVLTYQNLLVGDVDSDGDLDLIVAAGSTISYSALMRICFNDGAGGFGRVVNLSLGSNNTWPVPDLLADLDGDGDLDFIAQQWSADAEIRFNQGTLTSSRPSAGLGTDLILYPNPAHQAFWLSVRPDSGLDMELGHSSAPFELLNALGQVVARGNVPPARPAKELAISVGSLPAGLYTVRVSTPGGVYHQKLIIN